MRRLFGDVVPDEICRRDSKASFGGVAVARESLDFLKGWNGEGVDSSVIDVERFRAACQEEAPAFGTQLLLQSAWLGVFGPRSSPDAARGCQSTNQASS